MPESDFARGRDMVESELRPLGVRLIRDVSRDDQPFGNAYADFGAPPMCLRLLSDRGDLYLQISSVQDLDEHGESSHWYPLEGVIQFLGGELGGQPPTLSTLAGEIRLTRDHWPVLSQLFVDWPASKKGLDGFLRKRFDEEIGTRAPPWFAAAARVSPSEHTQSYYTKERRHSGGCGDRVPEASPVPRLKTLNRIVEAITDEKP